MVSVYMGSLTLVNAQILTPQIINAAGKYSANGSIQLESSVGGLVVQDVSNTAIMYTPDFLQPDAGTTMAIPVINNVALNSGTGVNNAGTTFTTGNTAIEFTVGEFVSITVGNSSNMVTQGILQPFESGSNLLPVTGLEFQAKRLNAQQVQLDWKTVQEYNNNGFYIERRKEHEHEFTSLGFINSKATSGHSDLPLYYRQMDANDYAGTTFYRVKQEDMNERCSWSVIKIVPGTAGNSVVLKVWPIPAREYFSVAVSGVEKDWLVICDLSGRIVKQQPVKEHETVLITGFPAGTYIIRLRGQPGLLQKVIVQ